MDEIGLSTGLMAFHSEIVGNTEIRAFDPFNPLPNTYTSFFLHCRNPFSHYVYNMFLRPLPIVVSGFSFPVEKAAGKPPLPQGFHVR